MRDVLVERGWRGEVLKKKVRPYISAIVLDNLLKIQIHLKNSSLTWRINFANVLSRRENSQSGLALRDESNRRSVVLS